MVEAIEKTYKAGDTLVSIIMPAYNAQSFLSNSIDSVINQTHQEWELIIVNDGSIDRTKEIGEQYCVTDRRIKLINQANTKQGGARNTGLKQAKGEWIAFLDADDLWEPEKLHKQLQAAQSFADADVIYSDGCVFYNNDVKDTKRYPTTSGLFSGTEMYKMEYKTNYIPILSVLLKKSVLDKVGLQDEETYLQGCEDWDYWIRIAEAGFSFYGMQDLLFYYRRHSSNMSANELQMRFAQALVFIKNYDGTRFTQAETKSIFKPLVIPLVISLLRENKIQEASFLIKASSKKIPLWLFRFNLVVFTVLKKNALFLLRLNNKIDTIFFN